MIKCLDCHYCYACSSSPQHCYWCNFCFDATENCAFVDGATDASFCFYTGAALGSSNCKFCYTVIKSTNLEYCLFCHHCMDCFGCVGLNHKQFHIFNKPYTEQEYWQKVDELKCVMFERGEYGNFFPSSHAASQFLESMEAAMLGVQTKEMGKKIGANFFNTKTDGAVGNIDSTDSYSLADIPECIDDVSDEWIQRPIFDPSIGRRFAFFPQELSFYRKKQLAVPNKHFILRVRDLLAECNVGQYEKKFCGKCQKELIIAKNLKYQDRIIYCKPCYLNYLEQNG
ncbi:hypothetical protein CO172_02520 [Candidatus Uhrbacteria bacterium CG_4_9_14_3_um_filter_36_7]|uniref:Uncharacterized protein n=1 Tax=Candidatus Uhrbacteria bacterium CG_4_9_14_3_um_filter_36_7 TaxID=1975033 RepID=A0A2M7XH76_9BACT|nr:MAG: hypothetical protein CO172_02520 [Candidatus Uhrbacteria bacterium CG_4_9_14_3_um_filter_36_7]